MANRNEVRLELLIGRHVLDRNGRDAGPIEEVRARRDGVVLSFHLGRGGALERFNIHMRTPHKPLSVPWQQLDLGDPEHPRLRCTVEELAAMQ